jgi:hypothetical protein
LSNIPTYFNSKIAYFCKFCDTMSRDMLVHRFVFSGSKVMVSKKNFTFNRCVYTCGRCHRQPACEKKKEVRCKDCNLMFHSTECLNNHLELHGHKAKRTVCQRVKFCNECGKVYRTKKNEKHVCSAYYCSWCKKTVIKSLLKYLTLFRLFRNRKTTSVFGNQSNQRMSSRSESFYFGTLKPSVTSRTLTKPSIATRPCIASVNLHAQIASIRQILTHASHVHRFRQTLFLVAKKYFIRSTRKAIR